MSAQAPTKGKKTQPPITGGFLNLAQLPGYAQAVAKERNSRDSAFFDEPILLCGKPVVQMNVIHWLTLDAIDSALLRGAAPNELEIPKFLWLMNPRFSPKAKVRRFFFYRSCRKLKYEAAAKEILDFVNDTFCEAPGGKGGGKSYYSVGASITHAIAFYYHWSERDILKMPLKRIFQYYKTIRGSIDPDAPKFNPSDRCVSRWLQEVNRNGGTN